MQLPSGRLFPAVRAALRTVAFAHLPAGVRGASGGPSAGRRADQSHLRQGGSSAGAESSSSPKGRQHGQSQAGGGEGQSGVGSSGTRIAVW